jgi:hypothetical protein
MDVAVLLVAVCSVKVSTHSIFPVIPVLIFLKCWSLNILLFKIHTFLVCSESAAFIHISLLDVLMG